MLPSLVVSLVVNGLLLVFGIGMWFERNSYMGEYFVFRNLCRSARDERDRLKDTVDIQAKRLLDIQKLTKT